MRIQRTEASTVLEMQALEKGRWLEWSLEAYPIILRRYALRTFAGTIK
jgi:hypothetical protein